MNKKFFILIGLLLLLSSPVLALSDADVVAYYTFNQSLADSTGNASNLLVNHGAAPNSDGIIDYAYFYDQTNDHMNNANINLRALGDFSINLWPKSSNTANNFEYILSASDNTQDNNWLGLNCNNDATHTYIFSGKTNAGVSPTAITTSTSCEDSTYRMITITYDASGTSFELFINTVSQGTSTFDLSTDFIDFNQFVFGRLSRLSPGNYYGGLIDETLLYDEVLTSGDMTILFNSGAAKPYPFDVAPVGDVNDSVESTAIVKQIGGVSFTGLFTTIVAADFNVSINNTPVYGAYNFNVLSNGNNVMYCELLIDGVSLANVTRNNVNGVLGSVQMQTEVFTVTNGTTHTQELRCQRVSGVGLTTVSETVGIGHFLIDQEDNFLQYNSTTFNISNSVPGYNLLDSFNLTISNKTTTNGTQYNNLVVEGSAVYTSTSLSNQTLNTYMVINGTTCAKYPRDVEGLTSGSVGFDCMIENVTVNATYQIDFYGRGNATYNGNIVAKNFFLSDEEILGGTGIFNGTVFNGSSDVRLFNGTGGNLNHAMANVFQKLSYTLSTDIDTQVNFYIKLINGTIHTTKNFTRDFIAGEIGNLIGQDSLIDVSQDTYDVQLWANCGTIGASCTIVGGSSLGYVTDVITSISRSFNVTAYSSFSNDTLLTFDVVNGGIYNTTNGLVVVSTTQDFLNLTVSSTDYFDRVVLNHSTNNSLNVSLNQSMITFRAFEIITDAEIFNANFSVTDGTVTQLYNGTQTAYLPVGNYNVTTSAHGYFDKLSFFTVTALDIKDVNITDMSSNIINLTVQNRITSAFIINFSGVIRNDLINYLDTFITNTGSVNLSVAPGYDYNITLDTIQGLSDFDNSVIVNSSVLGNSTIYNLTILLYTNNSVQFRIFDLDNVSLIIAPVNISMVGSTVTYNFNTSNGTLYVDMLNDDTYLTTISSNGYNDQILYLTLFNNAHLNANVFLQQGTAAKTFSVQDNNLVPLANVVLSFSTIVNGTSIVITQGITDFSGQATVFLEGATPYEFTAIKNGYDTFIGNVTPSQATYSIIMDQTGEGAIVTVFDDVSYAPTFNYLFGANNATAGHLVNSIGGSLEYFGLYSVVDGNTFLQNITTSPSGGFPNITINGVENVSLLNVTYFFKSSISSEKFEYTLSYFIDGVEGTNISLNGGLFTEIQGLPGDSPTRGLIGAIIVSLLVIIGVGATRNMNVGVLAGLIGVAVNYQFVFWSQPICIVSLIVGTVLLIGTNINS